jgi:hypothetical protein
MFISPTSRVTRLSAGAWPRRITGPGRCHRRCAGLGRSRPGRLRHDHPDPGTGGAYGPVPAAPGGTIRAITVGMPGGQIALAALTAAAAGVPGPRAGQPPGRLRHPGDTPPARARQAGCTASLTRMPAGRQNTQICGPQKTNAKGRPTAQNGGSRAITVTSHCHAA